MGVNTLGAPPNLSAVQYAGNRTGYVGKWHLEGGPKPGFVPPEQRFGFVQFVGFDRCHEYQSSICCDDAFQPCHSARYKPDCQTDQLLDFIAECYRMIHNIDWNPGRILNRRDALGISEDTMVICLSDHGDTQRSTSWSTLRAPIWRAAPLSTPTSAGKRWRLTCAGPT